MIDCTIVGRYLGQVGLSAMKLAMPVSSIISLFSSILGTGLAVYVIADILVIKLNAGMIGIAIATGVSYLCAFLVIAAFFMSGRSMFRLKLRKPDGKSLSEVVTRGMPMVVKGLCGILWPLAVNRLMLRYGTITGLAALSVQDAVHYLPAALCSGIASATLVLVGIFSREQDTEGMRKVNTYILRWSLIGGSLMALALELIAKPVLTLFSSDSQVVSLGASALRLYLIGVPFLALNFSASSYLQGMGRNRASGIVIFVNHILIAISSAYILARCFGTKGIFAYYGVCEIVTAALLFVNLLIHMKRKKKRALTVSQEAQPELRASIHNVEDAVSVSMQVHDFCIANGLSSKEAHHISLCTEELAANSIEHGFNDGKEHHLELRTIISDNVLLLRLRDDCRRFDLVHRYKIINPDDPTKNIGLRIVFSHADDVLYSSALSMNNVCVKYKIRR